MTSLLRLTDPDDATLNRAFAEHVAGWTSYTIPGVRTIWHNGKLSKDEFDYRLGGAPTFTASADAVVGHLEKFPRIRESKFAGGWLVEVSRDPNNHANGEGRGYHKDRAMAELIAILRAHGVQVEFTK